MLLARQLSRSFSCAHGRKVAVLGANGGIGQSLSLLLKDCDLIGNLALYDLQGMPGVAADLSHICTPTKVSGYNGLSQIGEALPGSDVVLIPAGVPRKPGMTRDDLFNTNAGIVRELAEQCATHCPNAKVLIISNPVNSTVPIFAEVMKRRGVYNPRHLFGVTTLDILRAKTFVAESQGFQVRSTKVDVIGGHAGTTILPLLSQVTGAHFSEDEIKKLTHRIQFGGDEVVNAKEGKGSATLSMAYAGAQFTFSLLRALSGERNIRECTFVESTLTSAPFFSSPVTLGVDGIEEVHGFGQLSQFEQATLDAMLPDLIKQAEKGFDFVRKQ